MHARLLIAAIALVATPGLALAMGCSGKSHDEVTMSCPEGLAFDTETRSCKPPATG